MKFAGFFAVAAGFLMIGIWGFSLTTGKVPEIQSAPLSIGFHLAAEILTALALLLSGLAILKKLAWGRTLFLVAGGMLLYTVIVSPGYFAQRGQWPIVAMFGILFLAAVVSLMNAAFAQPDKG